MPESGQDISLIAGDMPIVTFTLTEAKRSYTVNATTDVLATTGAHGLANGDKVAIEATESPGGLEPKVIYFVRDVTANTLKLAASSGGAAIDITSAGKEVRLGKIMDLTGKTVTWGYSKPTSPGTPNPGPLETKTEGAGLTIAAGNGTVEMMWDAGETDALLGAYVHQLRVITAGRPITAAMGLMDVQHSPL